MKIKVLIATAMIMLLASCSRPGSSQEQQIYPVTCDGWLMHVVNVETSDSGDGWVTMVGKIAFENINAYVSSSVSRSQLISGLEMTTNEGYRYPVEQAAYTWTFMGDIGKVPPGFTFIEDHNNVGTVYLYFRVAEGTQGHIVQTSCGILDFDHPETNWHFPTSQPDTSFLSLGTPIDLTEGKLVFTSAEDGSTACSNDMSCLHLSFTNSSGGYDAEFYLTVLIEGSDGILNYGGWGGGENDFHIFAGPGQTVESDISIRATTKQERKLIVMKDNQSWVFNIP